MSPHLPWWLVSKKQEVEAARQAKGYNQKRPVATPTVFFSKELQDPTRLKNVETRLDTVMRSDKGILQKKKNVQ